MNIVFRISQLHQWNESTNETSLNPALVGTVCNDQVVPFDILSFEQNDLRFDTQYNTLILNRSANLKRISCLARFIRINSAVKIVLVAILFT